MGVGSHEGVAGSVAGSGEFDVVAVVGEPVDITALSEGRPAFSKIQEVTALLKKREEELEAFAETI